MSSLIRFKDFITEIELEKDEWGKEWNRHYSTKHSFEVGKHKVDVHYQRQHASHTDYAKDNPDHVPSHRMPEIHNSKERKQDGKIGDNHWNVSYTVNDAHGRQMAGKDNKTRMKIVHGVRHSIHHFIKDQKPKSIAMHGHTKKKAESYEKLANHIAKKHKGKRVFDSRDYGEGHAVVHFPHHPANKGMKDE